jgi:hypothetical protein
MQLKSNGYADSTSTFVPFQYHPQQQYKQQQQFTVQFPIDVNRQTTQSIDLSNKQNLAYANSIDAEPLFCTFIPIVPTYQLATITDNSNYDVFLKNVHVHTGQAFYNPLKSLFKGNYILISILDIFIFKY